MILVILTALLAVCGAAKLEKTYLPPITAKTAGGSPGDLQGPLLGVPSGSYTNDVQGVVVDAVNPGTRTSGDEPTGLGGPRASYGSINSKVGEAAFHSDVESSGPGIATRIAPGFDDFVTVSGGSQADITRAHTLKFANDVGLDNYSYQYETDNGISVGENGVATDGVQANGGYSFKGDDGKTYSVSYTADEGGYRPHGQHLPTPPPIPDEILKSLEKNAEEEAAGLVDDGSYDAQKYNEDGDYSSNDAGNNKDKPTIGGADATASGSFVALGNEAQRPTSGVLIGTYKPTATSQTVEENAQVFGQVSGNKQSSLDLIKEHRESQGSGTFGSTSQFGSQSQFGAKPQESTSYTQSTQTTFGVQGSKYNQAGTSEPQAHAQASISGSPVDTQSLHGTPKGNSAYSSAVTTGSGSASAFASTGPTGYDYKNYYNTVNNLGSTGQLNQGSKLSSVELNAPSTASASAYVSGTPTFGTHYQQNSGKYPSSTSATASALGSQAAQNTNSFPSRFGENQSGNVVTSSQYVPIVNIIESTGKPTNFGLSNSGVSSQQNVIQSQQTGPTEATYFASTSQKPAISVAQQGIDNAYYYQQPSKPFVTQSGISSHSSNSQVFSNRQPNVPISSLYQQGSKYFNTPSSSNTGQSEGSTSSSYNGVTQAVISSFPSRISTSSQSVPQSSQFDSKPISSLFSQPSVSSQQTSPQFGSQTFSQKPISTGQNLVSSQVSTQQHQGTVYEYNKPAQTLPVPENKDTSSSLSQVTSGQTISQTNPSQVSTDSKFGLQQGSTQSKPFGSTTTQGSTFQQTQTTQDSSFGSQTNNLLGQKPQTNQEIVTTSTTAETSQFGQAPVSSSQTTGSSLQQNRFGSTTSSQSTSGVAPQSQFGQASQFGQKPFGSSQTGSTYQQTQFGSTTSQLNQKPQTTQGTSFVSTTGSKDQTVQTPQLGQKPFGSSQTTGSSYQQNRFGSTTSSQSTSGVAPQSQFGEASQFGQKPFGSSQTGSTYQQTQFGSTTSQLSQKPQTTQGTSFVSTTGSKDQTVQTTQLGQKPFGSSQTTGSIYQQNRFGSTTSSQSTSGVAPQSQFGQASQFGQKPFGSSQTGSTYQQTQFGSTTSQLSQKPQTTQGTSFVSTTGSKDQTVQTTQLGQKPFGSSQTTGSIYQQNRFGSTTSSQSTSGVAPQSQFGQASQFGQKPFGSSQTGSTYQQTQFGSTTSQLSQKPQTTQGTSFVSTTGSKDQTVQTTQLGQKPFGSSQTTGSSYQQNRFGSTTSSQSTSGVAPQNQFGQGSQFGQKPFGSSQTGSTYQQTQFGSTTSQLNQKPQTTQGSSFVSTTGSKDQTVQTTQLGQKPFGSPQPTGSSYQQNQFGSSASSQSTSGVAPQSQFGQASQFGQKPFGSSQTGSTYQQTQFGSTTSQLSQKPQTTQGTSFVSTTGSKDQTVQTTQLGQKPFGSSQTAGSSFQQNRFGSTTSSQSTSGVAPQSQFGQASQFGQKPFGSSQTGSTYQQTQFGSTTSQLSQKPQTTQGTSFVSTTGSKDQTVQTTQLGQKPFGSSQTAGSSFQQNRFGSTTSSQSTSGVAPQSQFGQASQFGQKPFGSSQTGSTYQQTQFGSTTSQLSQKPQTTQGTSFVSTTGSKDETVQTTQFGQKPFGSSQTAGSSFQQNRFGSTTSSQSTSGVAPQSQFGQAPQFGQKPFGSSQTGSTYQQTQFGSTTSQLSQKPQTTQGTSFVSTTGSKDQTVQTTQLGQKPFGSSQTAGSSFQQNRFGSTTSSQSTSGVAPQSQFGQASQFGQKPFGSSQIGSTYQQTQFGSTTSQLNQKPQTTQGTSFVSTTGSKDQTVQTTQLGQKPFGSSQTAGSSYQQNRFGSTTSSKSTSGVAPQSQFGQASQFGQKPLGSSQTGSTYQQTQFGSATSQLQASQFGQKPFGSSQTGSTYQQTQSSSTASKFGQQSSQQNVPTLTTVSQTVSEPTLSGQKPIPGSQTSDSSYQLGSFGSQFVQKPASQTGQSLGSAFGSYNQASQIGTQAKKPIGTTQTQFGSTTGQSQASAFASSSDSNISQFGSQTLTNQESQLGTQNQGITTFGSQAQKPVSGSLTQTNYQQSQYTQTPATPSRLGEPTESNVGNGLPAGQTLFAVQPQKPFGSQSAFQQSQFNEIRNPISSLQSTQTNTQASSTSSQSTQGTFGSTQTNGYNYQKPDPIFNIVSSLSEGQINSQNQNTKPADSSYTSQISVLEQQFSIPPIESISNQGSYQQNTITSNRFGSQPAKLQPQLNPASVTQGSAISTTQYAVETNKPISVNQFISQPFTSLSAKHPNVGSQNSVVSTQYVQPTQNVVITTQKPSQSVQNQFNSETLNPTGFASAQASSFPSRLGSNVDVTKVPVVSTAQSSVTATAVPEYLLGSSQGIGVIGGQGELFGGPRDPPKFDDKTGYHY